MWKLIFKVYFAIISYSVCEAQDTEPPTLQCPDGTTYLFSNLRSNTTTYKPPDPIVASDNSGKVTNIVPDPALLFPVEIPIGWHDFNFIATDLSGNVGFCVFFVVVQDIESPRLECPPDSKISTDVGLDTALVDYSSSIIARDNSGETLISPDPVMMFPFTAAIGEMNFTFTATDPYGNSDTCTFKLTVEDVVSTPQTTLDYVGVTTYNFDSLTPTVENSSINTASENHQDVSPMLQTTHSLLSRTTVSDSLHSPNIIVTTQDDSVNTTLVMTQESVPTVLTMSCNYWPEVVICETETPELINIPLTQTENSITFSTSTDDKIDEKDGPFQVIASLIHQQGLGYIKTSNGGVFPRFSNFVNITVYNKNQEELSVASEIIFHVIKDFSGRNNTDENHIPECYYTQGTLTGLWFSEGCVTIYDNNYLVNGTTCRCSHLTSFVILIKPTPIDEDNVLSLLTITGLAFSSLFLIITLIIVSVIRDLRNSDRYRLLGHLVTALIFVNLFFLLLEVDVEKKIACSVLAGCLHYSLLVAFSFMLIISTDVYMKIQYPFIDHKRYFVASLFIGWISPVFIVMVTAAFTQESYASNRCWLNASSGAIWSFIVPVFIAVVVVLIQITVIGFIAFKKSQLPNPTQEESQTFKRIRTLFCGIVLLTPAVGLSWIFGVVVVFDDSKVIQYIYVILNSFQGFFIWLSQCVFSKEVRQAVKKNIQVGQSTTGTGTY